MDWEEALLRCWGAETAAETATHFRQKVARAREMAAEATTGAVRTRLLDDARPLTELPRASIRADKIGRPSPDPLERDNFRDAQPGAVGGGECRLVLRRRYRAQQKGHFLDAEHCRYPPRIRHDGEPARQIRPIERHCEKRSAGPRPRC